MIIKGIDISKWQKNVNFGILKDVDEVQFVILKAGGSDKGCYTDPTFHTRYEECKKHGIAVGAYYFVGKLCDSAADGYADAVRFLHIIEGKQFEYPVYIDFEAPSKADREGNTEACIAFCDYMESRGYYVGIYASDVSGFKERLNISKLASYDKWVARYGKQPEFVQAYGMWQCSSKGLFAGIDGNVDCDVSLKDYPAIMKKAHLNGF